MGQFVPLYDSKIVNISNVILNFPLLGTSQREIDKNADYPLQNFPAILNLNKPTTRGLAVLKPRDLC